MKSHENSLNLQQPSTDKLAGLHEHLQGRVIGQTAAVTAFARGITPGELGLTRDNAPRSFLLLSGPTGTGKTKLVLEASAYLYPKAHVARIDMAEFSSESSIPRLVGERGGEIGLIGEQFRRLKESGGHFLLLDEIEKAHKKASDLFLGMEAARITLATNETLDLSGVHVLVTTNLGASQLSDLADSVPQTTVRRVVEEAAKEHFRPEVLGRFDDIVVYRKLSHQAQMAICRMMLDEEQAHLERVISSRLGTPHRIIVSDGVFDRLVASGYHRHLGARPMRSVVKRSLGNAVADALISGRLRPGMSPASSCLALKGSEFHLGPS
jgi:ATP-dependent Clp protease ATP-binding subunit ClpA